MIFLYRNRDWLYHQYIVLGKSTTVISLLCECDPATIWVWLKKLKIPVFGDKDLSYRNKDWLYHHYIILKKSTKDLAKGCNINRSTIDRWLKKFDIPMRTWKNGLLKHSEEAKRRIGKANGGENHWSWQGGPEKRTCEICGITFLVSRGELNRGNGRFCSKICASVNNMRTMNKSDTDIEILIEKWLLEKDITFEKQYLIRFNIGFTKVDFFIEPNVCLYVDGDYYHNLPDAIERDERNNNLLPGLGYEVIRIKGSEIHAGIRPDGLLQGGYII